MPNDTPLEPTKGQVATLTVFGVLALGGITYALWALRQSEVKAKAVVAQRYQAWESGKGERLKAMQAQAIRDAAKEAEFRARAATFKQARTA